MSTKSPKVWNYRLRTEDDDIMTLTTFDNYRVVTYYHVTIQHDIIKSTNKKYPNDKNIINSVTYGDLIKDVELIKKVLEKEGLTTPMIKKIIEKYGKKTLEVIINGENGLERFKKADAVRIYTDFFTEMGVKYEHIWQLSYFV